MPCPRHRQLLAAPRSGGVAGGVRERLAHDRCSAPLFDRAGLTRHIEQAYRIMCEASRAGRAAASFAVNATTS
jgi:hypothetical protein